MKSKKFRPYFLLFRAYRNSRRILNNIYFFFQKKRNKRIINNNLKNGIFAVEIVGRMGVGATMINALEIIAYCDENGFSPLLKFTHPDDRQQLDYFESYYKIRNSTVSTEKIRFARMRKFTDLNLDIEWNYNHKLSLEYTFKLLNKYIEVKDTILNDVDKFQSMHLKNKNVLGVHYRGTDKKQEAPLISFDTVEININHFINKYPETQVVFLSSDDQNFIDYIKNRIVNCKVIFHDDSIRSSNGKALHITRGNLHQIYKDALINCLLLSKCTTLMKTASNLSDLSIAFNPKLNLVLLSKPFEQSSYFPGKALHNKVLYDPITNEEAVKFI